MGTPPIVIGNYRTACEQSAADAVRHRFIIDDAIPPNDIVGGIHSAVDIEVARERRNRYAKNAHGPRALVHKLPRWSAEN
jgi:hypothetical protein